MSGSRGQGDVHLDVLLISESLGSAKEETQEYDW